MPVRDITTNSEFDIGLKIQAISTDTTTVGEIIDVSKYDGGVNYIIAAGTLTDGTYTPALYEDTAPAMGTESLVADADMVKADPSSSTAPEAQAALAATDDDTTKKLGYVGSKRYIRLKMVSASTSSGGTLGAIVQRDPEVKPAAA